MQDIVYKLVPQLQKNELKREQEFYRIRGLPCPKDLLPNGTELEPEKPVVEQVAEADFHRMDEQVNVGLECTATNLKSLKRKYLRLSSQATVTHLKKFIAKKVLDGMEKYRDIDILCNDELLGKDHTLKFVYVTRWRFRDPPLRLQYRPRIDL